MWSDDGSPSAGLYLLGREMARKRKEPEATGAAFADRLNHLFATHPAPTGEPYSLRQVSDGTGGAVSRAYLSTLRSGKVPMPGVRVVEALARFWQVPTGYFLGHDVGDVRDATATATDDPLDDAAALRLALADPLVKDIALRVKDFGPEEWTLMIGMVENQMALRRLAEERRRAPPLSPTAIPTNRRRRKDDDPPANT